MCAARLHCLKKRIAAKRVFSSHDEFFMICALSCFDKSASKLDSLFMSNEERDEAQKKKTTVFFCDIIQMRDMNSCKNFNNQELKLISKRQVLWRMLSSALSAINHRERKQDR